MTAVMEIYKCEICGNIVETLHDGKGTLVCCGQAMKLMQEKNADLGTEKHKPVIEKTSTGFKVKVGLVPHPMLAEHFIEWIELIADGKICRQQLAPGKVPEAEFCISAQKVWARAYCNVHGLWKSD